MTVIVTEWNNYFPIRRDVFLLLSKIASIAKPSSNNNDNGSNNQDYHQENIEKIWIPSRQAEDGN